MVDTNSAGFNCCPRGAGSLGNNGNMILHRSAFIEFVLFYITTGHCKNIYHEIKLHVSFCTVWYSSFRSPRPSPYFSFCTWMNYLISKWHHRKTGTWKEQNINICTASCSQLNASLVTVKEGSVMRNKMEPLCQKATGSTFALLQTGRCRSVLTNINRWPSAWQSIVWQTLKWRGCFTFSSTMSL